MSFSAGADIDLDPAHSHVLDRLGALALTQRLRHWKADLMSSDLGMRRRRALWRATHRGSKEMDFLLGRYAEHTLDGMNASEIAVFERLIEAPDPAIESCVLEGYSLGEADLDELIERLRRFHGLAPTD
jgi:antitoxin CptB